VRIRRAGALAALALLWPLAAAPAAEAPQPKTVTVLMVEYAFKPAQLSFRRGVAYRLHLDNRGKETHEFTAPDFFKAIDMRNPEVVNADRTEIAVQPGTTKDLYFVARQPGAYGLHCADHDWAGMVGHITIAP